MATQEIKCPQCKSDRILPKSNQEEFNPKHEVLVCCKCMCHFKKNGEVIKDGRTFEPYKPRKKKSRRRSRRTRKNLST